MRDEVVYKPSHKGALLDDRSIYKPFAELENKSKDELRAEKEKQSEQLAHHM